MHRERGNALVIIIGILLILFIIGFFRSNPSFGGKISYKQLLRLPCGLTIKEPGEGNKEDFPLKIRGYINECGWQASGAKAGTAQVFDAKGKPISLPTPLLIPSDSFGEPYYFEAMLLLTSAPGTDTGTIVITSTTGLLHVIPILF